MIAQITYIERDDNDPMILQGALSEREVLEAALDATSYRHFGCTPNGGKQHITQDATNRAALGVVEEHAPSKPIRSRRKKADG